MFCNIQFPIFLSGHTLDQYLAQGWFRMGQSMFTTSFLHFNETLFDALWLRYDLKHINYRKSTLKIINAAADLTISYGPLAINDQKENLYQRYRLGTHFSTSISLQHLLLESANFSIFNTREVCIYKDSELIAMGVFDIGKESAQGLINFYDPAYHKMSLGKLLIASKLKYCTTIGLQFFYPGYLVPGYPSFNYKSDMFLQGVSYFNIKTTEWNPYESISYSETPLECLKGKLDKFVHAFPEDNIDILKYQFFDLKLYKDYFMYELLDYPYFILGPTTDPNTERVLVYNLRSEKYEIILCTHLFETRYMALEKVFTKYFLQPIETIFVSDDVSEVRQQLFNLQTQ